ncbi:leucine-rich repeat protein [Halalkalibacter oceani]|uniref:leucine-rich repeat protein n=1 Tax=Halalkalibacter oceani TaxID=1653776 RepID=UPI003396B6F7
MKMKNKKTPYMAVIVIIALLMANIPPVEVNANDENFEYIDNGDGTATITGYTGPEGVGIVIPSELDGLTVTEIADGVDLLTGVFSHKNLTAVVIPDSITSIGEHAFNDNQLTEVTIPDSVTRIGRSAFHNNDLEAIMIPESVTDMGIAIFRGNQHTSSSFTIYGFTDSVAETYANDSYHTFKPLDTPPSVDIQYAGEAVADELQVFLQSSGELEAFYSHDTDIVEIDEVAWEVDGEPAGTGDTLSLESYTDTLGEIQVTLTVETNYGMTATAEVTVEVVPEFDYSLNDDGETATITGYNGTPPQNLVIPDEVNGLTVKEIGVSAFADNNLTEVVLGTGVESIGGLAFRGNNLTEVIIPDNVTEIGYGAFRDNDLTDVIIPVNVVVIGDTAFANNDLTDVIIHNPDVTFGNSVFQSNAADLRLVGYLDSTTEAYATANGHDFVDITGLDFTYTDNGDGTATITGYTGSGADIVIPSELGGLIVTRIGDGTGPNDNAFDSLDIETLVLPNTLEYIGDWAFANNSLTSVSIPDSVTVVGEGAFQENNLTSVDIPDSVTKIDGGAFRENNLESVDIPDSVMEIGWYAFANNKLTSVNIPESVTVIEMAVFSDNNLESVSIPDSVTEIGEEAFLRNTLTDVTIPDSVTVIGEFAFGLNDLTSVVIPDSVTEIWRDAFRDNNLTEVTILNRAVQFVGSPFGSNDALTLYGWEGSTTEDHANERYNFIPIDIAGFDYTKNDDDTATIDGWNADFGDVPSDLRIPDEVMGLTVTHIRDGATFNEGAFERKDIETLELPDTLEYIGNRAFAYNDLRDIEVPDNVTEIGRYAFSNNNLTGVIIPDSALRIDVNAFADNNLTEVIISDSVLTIGQYAFFTNNLTEVVIPDSVTHIENYALGRNDLTKVTVLNPDAIFDSDVFYENSSELILYGYENSTTEDYADEQEYAFIALDFAPDVGIMYDGEEVDSVLTLDYEESGQLQAAYSHPVANIEKVTWLVDGVEASTNETLDVSDYTSPPQTLGVTLQVETEYGAVGTANITITVAPPVPAQPNLSVDNTEETEIHLSWDPVPYADEYILIRDGDEEVYRGSSPSYEDTGLEPDTIYEYSLVAVNASGTSEASEASARTDLPVPAQPNLSVDNTEETEIHLSWDPVPYADEYILVRDDKEVYRGPSTSHVDTGLAPNTDYGYRLVAVNASGTSEAVEVMAKTALPVPSNLDITLTYADGSLYSPSAWTTQNVTAAVYASNEDGLPVDMLFYSLNNGVDWQAYTAPLEFATEGVHGLLVSAQDDAGNAVEAERTIRIDQTPPSVHFGTDGNESWSTYAETKVTVTDSPADANSGVDESSLRYAWTQDSSPPDAGDADWLPFTSGDNLTKKDADGDWYLHIQAADAAGNEVQATTNRFRLNTSERSSSGGGGGGSRPSNSRFIGSNGAVISFDGGEVEIPAEAWPRSFRLTIDTIDEEQLPDTLPLTDEEQLVSKVVTLTKDQDGPFQDAITLTLDLESFGSNMNHVLEDWTISLYWLDEEANEWVELDNIIIDEEQGTISGDIDHFTNFAAIARPVEAADEPNHPDESFDPRESEDDGPQMAFSDLDGHWAEEEIYHLVARGAIQGYPDGTFQPNQTMTRAEFVTMAVQALNQEGKGVTDSTERTHSTVFTDSEHHWARESISAGVVHGIVSGYDETTFGVNDPITREQMALIVLRAMRLKAEASEPMTFTDQQEISAWAVEAVAVLQAEGVMTGYPDGSFRPQQEVTRAEAAIVVSKVLNVLQNEKDG